jgi:hypothetical protein
MKILNLTNLKTSDISLKFLDPDGQQQVVIIKIYKKSCLEGDEYEFGDVHAQTDVQIKARLNN